MESHIAVFGKSANENEWGMYVAYSIDQLGVEKAVQKAVEFMETEKKQGFAKFIEYKLQGMEF